MRRDLDRQTNLHKVIEPVSRRGKVKIQVCVTLHVIPCVTLHYTIVSKKPERNRDRMSHMRGKCALFLISVRGTVSSAH